MDLLLIWRPWWLGGDSANWLPRTEGLHVDQNPLRKAEFACVQGMVPLYDVTQVTGGLEVVPCSHLPQAKELLIARCGEDMMTCAASATSVGSLLTNMGPPTARSLKRGLVI